MDETRFETTRNKNPWRDGWLGATTGLVLIAAALLSVAGAPASAPAPSGGRSSAAISAAPSAGPFVEADRDVLELQLD